MRELRNSEEIIKQSRIVDNKRKDLKIKLGHLDEAVKTGKDVGRVSLEAEFAKKRLDEAEAALDRLK